MHKQQNLKGEERWIQVECGGGRGGCSGLAIARKLALQGLEVMVLEAADAIGTGTSSHNSEVIHAGLYYPTSSLKARLCVAGRQQLLCPGRGVEHRRCGKLLVATADKGSAEGLEAFTTMRSSNGVTGPVAGSSPGAGHGTRASGMRRCLVFASTSIIDSHGLMLVAAGDLENAGACCIEFGWRTPVLRKALLI